MVKGMWRYRFERFWTEIVTWGCPNHYRFWRNIEVAIGSRRTLDWIEKRGSSTIPTHYVYRCTWCGFYRFHPMSYCQECPGRMIKIIISDKEWAELLKTSTTDGM
jgi:hypothetical protein